MALRFSVIPVFVHRTVGLERRLAMQFEQIETQKKQYTDKFVVVDATRPELARFKDVVGHVKTVNMSGRALVEFLDYHLNIGWYDIDPQFLKVVDKPPPKVAKPEEKKPAAKAEAKPAAAAKTPAEKKPAAAAPKAGKPSVADILAAARAGKAPGGAVASATVKAKPDPAPQPAKVPAAAPAKADRSKMSVAEMLAAARAGGAAGSAPAKAQAPTASVAPTNKESTPPTVGEVASTTVQPAAERKTAPKPTEKVDKSKMTIADIVAWCQQHDAK
jgi:hypothetical protein